MKKILFAFILVWFMTPVFGQSKQKTTDTAKKASGIPSPFRMHYNDLFKRNADNTVSPIQPLQVNGEIVNTAARIAPGIKYGGIDIASYAGHDLLVDTLRGVVIIRKFLK